MDLFELALAKKLAGGGGKPSPTPVSAAPKDVNFIDYDGTVLYAYTMDEMRALTALPPNPSHEGLVAQGWNWTLEEIKAQDTPNTIGQMYTTDDGATRFYIELTSPDFLVFPLILSYYNAGTNIGYIDWGDGTQDKLKAEKKPYNHAYAKTGKYTISIHPNDSTIRIDENLLKSSDIIASVNSIYVNSIKGVAFGEKISINYISVFSYFSGLEFAILPYGMNNYAYPSFLGCSSLRGYVVGGDVETIPSQMFFKCYALEYASFGSKSVYSSQPFNMCFLLKQVYIKNGQAIIPSYSFGDCYRVKRVEVPSSVKTIKDYFAQNMASLECIHFNSTTPPTASSSSVFSFFNTATKIYVPDASVDAYKAATNWTTKKSQIYPESEMPT